MILRPLEPLAPNSEPVPAWEAVERLQLQTQTCKNFWMITQPSHAALAGELAANMHAPQFPIPDKDVLRAIALHDAGWGMMDAQTIVARRAVPSEPPRSFLAMSVPQYLDAWEKSIETCESVSPAGGYAVSRHFHRLAVSRVRSAQAGADRQKLEMFLKNEERRQTKLAERQSLSVAELERLTDLLQLCDLLSLYLCSGAQDVVVFPEYFGVKLRAGLQAETYQFDPTLFRAGTAFAVAALRYPVTKAESSREIEIRIG